MASIQPHRPVLLLLAAFSRYPEALDWARQTAEEAWGDVALHSERFDHRAVSAGLVAETARLLDAVGGVEDDRGAEGSHLRQRPHVVDQPTVAEERAALAEQDVFTTALP